jgi:hypothetical protein
VLCSTFIGKVGCYEDSPCYCCIKKENEVLKSTLHNSECNLRSEQVYARSKLREKIEHENKLAIIQKLCGADRHLRGVSARYLAKEILEVIDTGLPPLPSTPIDQNPVCPVSGCDGRLIVENDFVICLLNETSHVWRIDAD